MDPKTLPRRDFMRNVGAAAAAFTLLPSGSYGKQRRISANDKVNVATVGCGGMGRANLVALANMNLVAMCDVDWNYVDSRFADISNQIANANKRANEATDPAQKLPSDPNRSVAAFARSLKSPWVAMLEAPALPLLAERYAGVEKATTVSE